MKNMLFIQSERFGKIDYLFVNQQLINSKIEISELISEENFLKKKFDFRISKHNNPFSETIKKLPQGFLINGQLNDKDFGGRYMSFTCLYLDDLKFLEGYVTSCLNQIGKSCNKESLKIIKNSILRYQVTKNALLLAGLIVVGIVILKKI
jgi:hypothetical protein